MIGATGPAWAPLSQTEAELQESHRLAAKREAQLGRTANTGPAGTVVPFQKPSNDNNEAPKKPIGHFDADVAKAYPAAEEAAKQLNEHAQTPSPSTSPASAEAKHDAQPPKQTIALTIPSAERASAAKAVPNAADILVFLSRVLPWPGPGGEGFCNLHWTMPNSNGMAGRPFKAFNDFWGMAEWCKNNPDKTKEIYFCLSLQKELGPLNKAGTNYRALRNSENAIAFKSLYCDIDCSPEKAAEGKGYVDKKTAADALIAFCKITGFPFPTAAVDSGGGIHAYRISDRPLAPDEWQSYAGGFKALAERHGFLCDPTVTADRARVLRVPGTFNRKEERPRPVKLLRLLPNDIDFAATLSKFKVASQPKQISRSTAKELLYDPNEFEQLVV